MEEGVIISINIPDKGTVDAIVVDRYIDSNPYGDIIYTCYSPTHHIIFVCVSHIEINDEEDYTYATPPVYDHIIFVGCVIAELDQAYAIICQRNN